METNLNRPSSVRSASSSKADKQNLNVRTAGTSQTVSAGQLSKALAYRFWCLLLHKWMTIVVFILIPILVALLVFLLKRYDILSSIKQNTIDVYVPEPFDLSTKLMYCPTMNPIGVTPDSNDTRTLMSALAITFRLMNISFGPIVYKNSENELARYLDGISNRSTACGFGINIMETSNTSFSYTLRSTQSENEPINGLYPNIDLGPTDNSIVYLKNGFLLLQYVMDSMFLTTKLMQGTPIPSIITEKMKVLRTLAFQGFPQPAYRPQNDVIKQIYSSLICFFTVSSTLFIAAVFGLWIVKEKASGMKELLAIYGTKTWMLYTTWFCLYMLTVLPIAIVITISWKYPLQTGALLPSASSTVILTTIILYLVSLIACIWFLCSLTTSSTVSQLLIFGHYVITAAFGVPVDKRNFFTCSLTCLWPNYGLREILEVIVHLEANDSGASYSNIFHHPSMKQYHLSIGVTQLVMIAGILLFILLTAYFNAVKPGQYGRAKPWYFCIKFRRSTQTVRPTSQTSDRSNTNALVEPTDSDKSVGLRIVNLVKTFGYVNAVNGLNWTIYKNEITVLLGHNGAGKSTSFNMICGMFSPTRGTIYTESYNIFSENHIEWFRKDLGYCPQHNLLFADLTAKEHLVFFGLMKGLTKAKALERSAHWAKKFKFDHRSNKIASQLSGGMKRKLCLSIALIGDPLYLLLDEPTSGLDPESRRDIWDALLSVRGNRTVVISTHDMEEAEVLGDRIAIIANGTLKCNGTTMFLKHHYGFGYQLKITTRKNNKNVLSLIQGIVPTARLLSKTENAVTVSLPAQEVASFPALFSEMDTRFNYNEYSLSATNMGDVFIKVQEDEGVNATVNPADMPSLSKEAQENMATNVGLQFLALIQKRWAYACRKWFSLLLWLILIPSASVVLAFVAAESATESTLSLYAANLSLDLSLHKNSTVFAAVDRNHSVSRTIESTVKKKGSKFVEVPAGESVVQTLLNSAKADRQRYLIDNVVAFDLKREQHPIVLFSTYAYHSLPIAWNTWVNAFSQSVTNPPATISTFSYPYRRFSASETCDKRTIYTGVLLFTTTILTGLGMLIAFSYFVIFPHLERTTGFKHLQIMTGVQPPIYWLANLIFDAAVCLTGVSLSLIVLFLLDTYEILTQHGLMNAIVLILYLYGISAVVFAYFVSYLFETNVWSMNFIYLVSAISAATCAITIYLLPWLNYILFLIPHAAFASSFAKIIFLAKLVDDCEFCQNLPISTCKKMFLSKPFFGITTELIYMAADVLLYLVIISLIDYGVFAYLTREINKVILGKIEETDEPTDANVVSEKQAVEALNEQDTSSESTPTFLCDGLGKKYSKNIVAVYDVTFVIPKNECFGLLGTNGAGKSTTFGMLTGILSPTKGDASIFSYSLTSDRVSYLKELSYCPQQDGQLPHLSARSHLMLLGRLRGVPSSELSDLVQKWVDVLDMTNICDRPCKSYSGGNKRKLSTAIALIGDPRVVLLDEPTTGVDPVVSRKLWSILKHCRDKNGQTIILTSHSMEECEAVCERLTIMVKGRMKCLGTVPYLKNTYGRGFVLVVKLKQETTEQEAKDVRRKIENTFSPHIRLMGQQRGLFTFSVSSATTLQKIFQEMIRLKASLAKIEDYNVSHISLEQVFISFAEDK